LITQGNRKKEEEFEFNKRCGAVRVQSRTFGPPPSASSSGLIGMEIQGAMAIFAVNLKRILKLME
jgi:hypothetical protein